MGNILSFELKHLFFAVVILFSIFLVWRMYRINRKGIAMLNSVALAIAVTVMITASERNLILHFFAFPYAEWYVIGIALVASLFIIPIFNVSWRQAVTTATITMLMISVLYLEVQAINI